MKSKIKAFTLSEMLVVLLITVIVVGLAFSVLNLVQKQMFAVREDLELRSGENELKQALWRDFRTFSRIYGNRIDGSIQLENPFEQVRYQFQEKVVLRNLDTFRVEIKNKDFFFLGNPIETGELDALGLGVRNQEGASIFVYKANAAETYMD
ncbi:prepilin-type N-terminal cleavage/methylation domain-containing protein [Flagellimonas allohymeniacidonis]|nr:prepilin-type N-terminal cleavage/methylation domain-containing protein [Allomuricauda hymeniacidonis]